MRGAGVAKDAREGIKRCREAAEQGYPVAQYKLAECHARGEGVPEDPEEAVKWYRKAAEQRHAEAQYSLGVCYRNGIGVSEDLEKAIKYWSEAIQQGDSYSLLIREQLGEYLSQSAVRAINAYDPETVVLAGYVCRQCPGYLAKVIHKRMETGVYDWSLRKVEIIAARCGDEALINGVTAAVLQKYYE